MYIIVYALLYLFILCKANPNIKAILLDIIDCNNANAYCKWNRKVYF